MRLYKANIINMFKEKGFHASALCSLLFLIGLVAVIGDEQKVWILCLYPYYLTTLSLSLSHFNDHVKFVQKFYIVYLGDHPVDKDHATQTHNHLLSSVKGR